MATGHDPSASRQVPTLLSLTSDQIYGLAYVLPSFAQFMNRNNFITDQVIKSTHLFQRAIRLLFTSTIAAVDYLRPSITYNTHLQLGRHLLRLVRSKLGVSAYEWNSRGSQLCGNWQAAHNNANWFPHDIFVLKRKYFFRIEYSIVGWASNLRPSD